MAHAFALFGWFIFNVAIPLLAPLALLPLARFAEFSHARSNGIVRRSVENGQFCDQPRECHCNLCRACHADF